MKRLLTIITVFLIFQSSLLAQCLTTADFPINTTEDASWSSSLYTSSQIGGPQNISKLSMKINNVASGTFTYKNVKIYMRESVSTQYANGNYPGTAGFTEVYNGDLQFNGAGLYSFTLTTPFIYSGNNSLEVFFVKNAQSSFPDNEPRFVRTKPPTDSDPYIGKHGYGSSNGTRRQYHLVINGINCDLSPLPVRLKSFTAIKEGFATELRWITTSEENASHFDVLHSANGKVWTSLGIVVSKGNKSSETRYSFDVSSNRANDYFRLKMVDIDDTFSFSRTLHVKGEAIASSTIFPNPVSNRIHFDVSQIQNLKHISVQDQNGNILFQSDKLDAAGIDATPFSKGLLIIKIIKSNGETFTSKIIKM